MIWLVTNRHNSTNFSVIIANNEVINNKLRLLAHTVAKQL